MVSSPAGHSFRVSPESLHLRLQELMLISVASGAVYGTVPYVAQG